MRNDLPDFGDSNIIEVSSSIIGKTQPIRNCIFLAQFGHTSFSSEPIVFVLIRGLPYLSLA